MLREEAANAFLLGGTHSSLLEGHDFAKNTAVVVVGLFSSYFEQH